MSVMFEVNFVVDLAGLKELLARMPDDADFSVQSLGKSTNTVEVEPTPPEMATPRGRAKRGSKVNSTILAALAAGPIATGKLKTALENAGLASGSLSTGLAQLQKSGEVERVGEGLYGLKAAEAAE